MRSPADMEIIQIDITNACVFKCSNCTRFLGHHKKPYFMDYQTFKRAVDSLQDFPGIVGIIGGEPTLHPEFEKFCEYILSKRGRNPIFKYARAPIYNYMGFVENYLFRSITDGRRIGLWSSLGKPYYKHFEIISDTFDYEALNDHNNTCVHQAILMARKELGISDEEFIKKRNNCWLQNLWSASITPRGAFFCEVAASLDMLFKGDGGGKGWDIDPGWWRRKVSDFGEQLKWCEFCSCCLDVPKRLSTDGRDDVTPLMYEKLKKIGSPKAIKCKVVIHTKEKYQSQKEQYKTFDNSSGYMLENNSIRIHNSQEIMPKEFVICDDTKFQVQVKAAGNYVWFCHTNEVDHANELIKILKTTILNPGCLYIDKESNTFFFNIAAHSLKGKELSNKCLDLNYLSSFYIKDKCIEISYSDFMQDKKKYNLDSF